MTKPRRAIHLADPPRRVPTTAGLAALFGDTLTQVGWGLVLFGQLFVALFALDSEAMTWIEFRGPRAVTEGEVVSVSETSASENERRIHRVHFRYQVEGSGAREAAYAALWPKSQFVCLRRGRDDSGAPWLRRPTFVQIARCVSPDSKHRNKIKKSRQLVGRTLVAQGRNARWTMRKCADLRRPVLYA